MILTLFQLQLLSSFEFPFSLSECFLFHRKLVLVFFCVSTCMSACVQVSVCSPRECHLLPGECFTSGFSLVFLFFLFYFLKIIFPFRNMFIRKPAPLPPRRTGHSHLFLNRTDFPSHPETGTPQDGLRRLESLPVWRNALVAVKAPLPQWRFLIVGHSLVFVFFLSSN